MNLIQSRIISRMYCTSVNVLRKNKWDLMSAVCLERKPVISRELNEIECNFSRMLTHIELENSYKSDHELRLEKDRLMSELLKSKSADLDVDQTLKQTAQDYEDSAVDEYNKFQFASRVTEADKTNDHNSLERKLDRQLLFLVEQELWGQKVWIMPQGLRMDGETMLQAAERVLQEKCGSDLRVQFNGNAPCGVYKYKYPKKFVGSTEEASVGAKVFFFKAQYIAGHVEHDKLKVNDFKWLGREELVSSLTEEYYKNISQFLVDED